MNTRQYRDLLSGRSALALALVLLAGTSCATHREWDFTDWNRQDELRDRAWKIEKCNNLTRQTEDAYEAGEYEHVVGLIREYDECGCKAVELMMTELKRESRRTFLLADSYQRLERYPEAIAALDEDICRGSAFLYGFRGGLHAFQATRQLFADAAEESYRLALSDCDQAIELGSESSEVVFARALALDGLGNELEARAAYEHFLTVADPQTGARDWLEIAEERVAALAQH